MGGRGFSSADTLGSYFGMAFGVTPHLPRLFLVSLYLFCSSPVTAPATLAAMTQWYVPYKDIKPLLNEAGVPGVFIWQAFPWLKQFYLDVGKSGYSGGPFLAARVFQSVPIMPGNSKRRQKTMVSGRAPKLVRFCNFKMGRRRCFA